MIKRCKFSLSWCVRDLDTVPKFVPQSLKFLPSVELGGKPGTLVRLRVQKTASGDLDQGCSQYMQSVIQSVLPDIRFTHGALSQANANFKEA